MTTRQKKADRNGRGDDPLLTLDEVSEFLGLPTSTLAAWRVSGAGPAFVRMGRIIRYRKSAIEKYIADSTLAATNGRKPEDCENSSAPGEGDWS